MALTRRRWSIRIGLALLGVVVLAIAGLLLWRPEGTLLILAILFQPLLGNMHPPPIAAGQFADATFQNQSETNGKLNALFQQKFPAGTSEAALKAALLDQGFKPLPPPRADCLPEGQPAPLRQVYTRCPTGDRSRVLEYNWSRGICSATITAAWAADGGQTVGDVRVGYRMDCL
jgi:hypothetical protein